MSRTFPGVELGSIEVFIKAAETLSFAEAAKSLGLSAPAVSRSIARLEARLGVLLFQRTTRQVSLTDDGRLYYEQCRTALAQIADAESAISGRRGEPSGRLRVSAPTTYAHHRLLPLIGGFRERYPKVALELNISNRNIDFVEEGHDAAIRLGQPADNRLVAVKLEDATLGLFASPRYLAKRKAPKTLDELREHQLISFERPSTGRSMPWLFRHGHKATARLEEWSFDSNLSCSDDVLGCVTLAAAGAGLFQIYHFVAADYVARGDLVEVLKAHAGASRPFSLLYPQNRHLSPKVRVLADFLKAQN
jgi:DNA-binding transcriptional LysR family regulator